ncbi:MAG: zinc-ribbon domain-containing protein [Promethearchaeota archaeon]|nr:MAG: zinc-ribbon domain-containing protein [Candidatus Lokiarchaeota archaeon]
MFGQNNSEKFQRKIKCPDCKEEIDEGLQFCPECGHRIPDFLRFNPD